MNSIVSEYGVMSYFLGDGNEFSDHKRGSPWPAERLLGFTDLFWTADSNVSGGRFSRSA
jgi:hypothetical protein